MAREVIIRTWCDACLADDQHTDGEELPPLLLPGQRQPKVVALCEVHRKELYEPLRDLVAQHGQVADQPAAAAPKATRTPSHAPLRPSVEGKPTTAKGVQQELMPVPGSGNRLRAAWRSTGDTSCPVPGCTWARGTRSAAAQHAKAVHEELLGVLEGRHGRLDGKGHRTVLAHQCDRCEAAYDKPGLVLMHQQRAHGVVR